MNENSFINIEYLAHREIVFRTLKLFSGTLFTREISNYKILIFQLKSNIYI